MDIFSPISFEDQVPVIVYIHGNGFEKGDKQTARHFCMRLSNHGFLVFSLGYRLCPETDLFGQLQDIADALHYVDKIAPKYRGIPGWIHMAGDSAGAFLALYTAAIQRNPVLAEAANVRPCYLEIKTLALINGLIYLQKRSQSVKRTLLGTDYRRHAFYPYLDPSSLEVCLSIPICLLITSKNEIYYPQSKDFASALKKWDTPHVLNDYGCDPNLSHAFCVVDPERPESRMVMHEIIGFFREHEFE